MFIRAAFIVALFAASAQAVRADDLLTRVSFRSAGGVVRNIDGKIVVDAHDESFLLMARDGRLWSVTPGQLIERTDTDDPFEPLSRADHADELRAEFGDGFNVFQTKNYLICSNAEKKYVEWCGILFERLAAALRSHWDGGQIKTHAPELPLVAIVFADQRSYARFASEDAGPDSALAKGYYSTRTNRIVLYDLTSELSVRPRNSNANVDEQLEAQLNNVATIVHEATHQIAFNCGLHTRYADNPLWLIEGMATYFETPDLRNRSGWKTLGRVNPSRIRAFREFVRNGRSADSLESLISSDERLMNPDTAGNAYAEAWALTYFLIKTKRRQYCEYLKLISEKPPLVFGTPRQRLDEFRWIFGDDLQKIDREFVRYMSRK